MIILQGFEADDGMSVSGMTNSSYANEGMSEAFQSAPPSPSAVEEFEFAVPTGGKPSLSGGKPAKRGKKGNVLNMVGGGKPLHRVAGKPGAGKPKPAGKPLRVRTRAQQQADQPDVMAFSNEHYGESSVTKVHLFKFYFLISNVTQTS